MLRNYCSAIVLPLRHWFAHRRDVLAVFLLALGLRFMFSALIANTFDKNEFVYLALGHNVAGGAVPYRSFAFFHPPGILVVLGLLDPLINFWWPLARLVNSVIDSVTAVLVWRVGNHLHGRRTGLAAAVLYAVNPVVLISAVRIDQEVLITALGMAGITFLVTAHSQRTAIGAGVCLAAACWIKYPMLVFLPVYMLVSPRRALSCLHGFFAATLLLFFPYAGDVRQMYDDTVTWQLFLRDRTREDVRLLTTAIFWLIINPLAVGALLKAQRPLYLVVGFMTGCVFLFTSSVYSPYFVPVAPFAALLGAPLAVDFIRVPRWAVLTACLTFVAAWAAAVGTLASEQGFIIASRFTAIRPIVLFIDRSTPSGTPILANRFEFAYLAGRPWVAHYFWDYHTLVNSQSLARRLTKNSLIVLYPVTSKTAYPTGFVSYLDAHYARVSHLGIWLTKGRKSLIENYYDFRACSPISHSITSDQSIACGDDVTLPPIRGDGELLQDGALWTRRGNRRCVSG
ncbi:MAG: hypothetical protein NVSMB52_14320 [Chloroflexota bacterium]